MIGAPLKGGDLVFSQRDGRPLLPDTVTRPWIKLSRRSGFNGVRLHNASHSQATLMLRAGIHPKIVQERLGHSSIQITLDTYARVVPSLQAATALRFDDGLAPTPSSEGPDRVAAKIG